MSYKIKTQRQAAERRQQELELGLLSLQYNDNEKIKELQIYEVPERTHTRPKRAI